MIEQSYVLISLFAQSLSASLTLFWAVTSAPSFTSIWNNSIAAEMNSIVNAREVERSWRISMCNTEFPFWKN